MSAIGWRVEMSHPFHARSTHEDFEVSEFASAFAYAETAAKRFPIVSVAPIHSPDRVRNPINTDCALDCPVCFR